MQHVQDKTFNCRLKDRGMLSNRISTLHKDIFMLLSKIQAGKYRGKCGMNILEVRPENRTAGHRQYNDVSNVSSIGRLRPDTMVPYAAMHVSHLCSCTFFPHTYAEGTHYTVEDKLVSPVPAQEPSRLGEVPK